MRQIKIKEMLIVSRWCFHLPISPEVEREKDFEVKNVLRSLRGSPSVVIEFDAGGFHVVVDGFALMSFSI